MKNKKRMLIIVLLSCILVFGGIIFALNRQGSTKAEVGTKTNDTQETIEKRKKQKVDKSILAATMEQVIEFADGQGEGMLNIENFPENNYDIEVEITNDQQEILYKSGRIEPGMILRKDKLKVELKKGNYLSTATFKAYDENGKEVKKANAQIEIQVKN